MVELTVLSSETSSSKHRRASHVVPRIHLEFDFLWPARDHQVSMSAQDGRCPGDDGGRRGGRFHQVSR